MPSTLLLTIFTCSSHDDTLTSTLINLETTYQICLIFSKIILTFFASNTSNACKKNQMSQTFYNKKIMVETQSNNTLRDLL